MKHRSKTSCKIFSALALLLLCLPVMGQQSIVTGNADAHVAVDLIPEFTTAQAGQTLWIALQMDHAEHWHSYWINPGEAGLPTKINWQLPEGVTAGEIVWPIPERFDLPADIVDFGYTGEIFLLTPLTIASDYTLGSLPIEADVQWLECEVQCILAGAKISLNLPLSDSATILNADWAWAFQQTRQSLPRDDIQIDSSFMFTGGDLKLVVQASEAIFENAEAIKFIPDVHGLVDYVAEQDITAQLSSLQLSQAQHVRIERRGSPERVGGLLLVTDEDGNELAYQLDAQPQLLGAVDLADFDFGAQKVELSIAAVFVFALLGGLILNLMPCVLPVLSLKLLSLMNTSNNDKREQRMHGMSYAAGVMLSFLALASVLLLLRAGGSAFGWGFQLQQPWMVTALIFVFFVMALSMSGVVEFGTSIMGIGSNLQEKEGLKGSFFTGVLAAVVASPCTAPFMGAALGFALTQSMPIALTVFLALGFGMALPFLLLSFMPKLGRLLPKPGAWMQTFRQVLAFPLYATAAWLLWVLGNQVGVNGMALVTGACVVLAFAAWLWQKRHVSTGVGRHAKTALVLISVGLALSVLISPVLKGGAQFAQADIDANYEPYTAARLSELRALGKPVFINMTASWCITCLVNEKVALSSDVIISAMEEKGITYLKGDWTNNDPAITEILKQFASVSVPLYILYPSDPSKPPEVLPQILTEKIMLSAFDRI